MKLPEWNPQLQREDFTAYSGDLERDLLSFSRLYMEKVTAKMVKVSIGLRTPELFEDTAAEIVAVPVLFKECLIDYFDMMQCLEKMKHADSESFGYDIPRYEFRFCFSKSFFFEDHLSVLSNDDYIKASVQTFVHGIL